MYTAIENENGTFTIKNLEIFMTYKDDKIEPNEMNKIDLYKMVENFEMEKKNVAQKFGDGKTFLPRVHAGHHEYGTEDKYGIGMLDNMYVDGDVLYSDIINIQPGVIKKIQQGKYPYRSVEISINDDQKKITSLALLESRDPYHKLPILDGLEFSVQEQYSNNSKVFCFSKKYELGVKNLVWFQKDKEENSNTDYAKKYEMTEEEVQEYSKKYMAGFDDYLAKAKNGDSDSDSQENPNADYAKKYEMTEEEVEEYNKKYMAGFDDYLAKAKNGDPDSDSQENGDNEESNSMDSTKMKEVIVDCLREYGLIDKGQGAPDANNIAMQNQSNDISLKFQAMEKKINELENQNKSISYEQELKDICDENPTLQFASSARILRAIPKDKEKEHFLNSLKESAIFSNHTGNEMLKNFNFTPVNQTVVKYQKDGQTISNLAQQLHKSYESTIANSSENERIAFQTTWKSVEDYVDFHVEEEKNSPGYCRRNNIFS